MDSTLYNEHELLRQIAAGDESSFQIFFTAYRDKVYEFIYRIVKSAAITEELVQDVFMKLWATRHRLTEVEKPSGYLFTIAAHQRIDYLRKAAGERAMIREMWNRVSAHASAGDSPQLNDLQGLINASLKELSLQKQTIFRLSRYEGLAYRAIAEQLGLSEGTIKNNMSETIRHIKTYLEKHDVLFGAVFIAVAGKL